MLRRVPAADEGLTLVELMIVVLILGVVGGITVTGLVRGMQTTDRIEARVEAFTDLQRAAERVARDLRRGVWDDTSVTPVPSPATGCSFISLDPSDVTLVVFDGTDRFRHRYQLVGNELRLDVDQFAGGTWTNVSDATVISDLDNAATGDPVFTYLDSGGDDLLADGVQGSDRAAVRKFRLTLVRQVRDQPAVDLQTTVAARNGGLPCPAP